MFDKHRHQWKNSFTLFVSICKSKTKNDSLVYYLKVILNKLTILSNQSQVRQINLMKNVLDHQDVHGDTCLHIAVRSGNIDIVKILLQYGAMDDLENINRETARQLITQCNLIPNYTQVDAAQVAYQNQMQLGMGDYLNYNVNNNAMNQNHNESSHDVPIVPGLATPIQSTLPKWRLLIRNEQQFKKTIWTMIMKVLWQESIRSI